MKTIDAAVLVAAALREEPAHGASAAVLRQVLAAGSGVHQPVIALVEVVAAVARRTGDRELAHRVGEALLAMPGLELHDLDAESALQAASLAADLRLRAADAVYVATARSTGSTLITLDTEVVERAGGVVPVASPAEWLAGPSP